MIFKNSIFVNKIFVCITISWLNLISQDGHYKAAIYATASTLDFFKVIRFLLLMGFLYFFFLEVLVINSWTYHKSKHSPTESICYALTSSSFLISTLDRWEDERVKWEFVEKIRNSDGGCSMLIMYAWLVTNHCKPTK